MASHRMFFATLHLILLVMSDVTSVMAAQTSDITTETMQKPTGSEIMTVTEVITAQYTTTEAPSTTQNSTTAQYTTPEAQSTTQNSTTAQYTTTEAPSTTQNSTTAQYTTTEAPSTTQSSTTAQYTTTETPSTTRNSTMGATTSIEVPTTGNITDMARESVTQFVTTLVTSASPASDETDTNFTMVVTRVFDAGDTKGTIMDSDEDISTISLDVATTDQAEVVVTNPVFATTLVEVKNAGTTLLPDITTVPTTGAMTTSKMTTSPMTTSPKTTSPKTTLSGDSDMTQGTTGDGTYDEYQTTKNSTALVRETAIASIRVIISVNDEEFEEALGDTSSSKFMKAAIMWEGTIERAYCNASSGMWDGTCPITADVTTFSLNPPMVHGILDIIHPSDDIVNTLTEFILNQNNIEILDENGIPYNSTVSGRTLITEAPVTVISTYSDLTCYACSTNDLTHSCSIGGSRITAFSTQMCRAGESCLTLKTSNTTHTSIVRKCASTEMYCDGANMASMSCRHAQPTGGMDKTECHRCCNTKDCNGMDAASSRPIPALILLLVTLFITMAI